MLVPEVSCARLFPRHMPACAARLYVISYYPSCGGVGPGLYGALAIPALCEESDAATNAGCADQALSQIVGGNPVEWRDCHPTPRVVGWESSRVARLSSPPLVRWVG